MIKQLELDFGILKIYNNNIIVSELKEGILFDVESNRKLLDIGSKEFNGRSFGYISNRIFSYAVDPMVYRESADNDNLRAIAVVTDEEICRRSALVEKEFFQDKNLFEIFDSFEAAVSWMDQVLNSTPKTDLH